MLLLFFSYTNSAKLRVLKFLLDNRLRTKEEAEKYLGIPVFAEFPEV